MWMDLWLSFGSALTCGSCVCFRLGLFSALWVLLLGELLSSTIRFCFRHFAGVIRAFFLHLSRPALSYIVLLCLVFSRRACDDRSLMPVFGSGIIFFGQFDSARLGLAWVGSARHILARLVLARRRAFSFACALFYVFCFRFAPYLGC